MQRRDNGLPKYWGIGAKPYLAPYAPDRFKERLWLGLAIFGVLSGLSLAGFIWLVMAMPNAASSALPISVVSLAAMVPYLFARRRRKRAEAEMARYYDLLRKPLDWDVVD